MDGMTDFKENKKSPKPLTNTVKKEMEGSNNKQQSTLSKENTTDHLQNVGSTQANVPENIDETQAESASQDGIVRRPEQADVPPSEDTESMDREAEPDTEIIVAEIADDQNHEEPDLIESLIQELKGLYGRADNSVWRATKIVYDLETIYLLSRREIMARAGRKKACISEWITAHKLGMELEDEMPDFREQIGVHKAKQISTNWKQLPKRLRKTRTIVEFAQDSINKPPRQVRRAWAAQEIKESSEKNVERIAELSESSDVENRCFKEDCLQWMDNEAELNPYSYRVLSGDVPYPYKTCDKLPVDHSQVSGLRVDCENATYQEAIDLTVGIIERAGKLLCVDDEDDCRGGGVLLIMQAGGQIVLPEIIEAVEAADMEIKFVVQIDTGAGKLANPGHPFGKSSETLLVIKRKGDRLIRCDTQMLDDVDGAGNLLSPHTSILTERQLRKYVYDWQRLHKQRLYRFHPKGNILANASKQNNSARWTEDYEYGDVHLFQKSESQLLLVLGKFAVAGDKIADLCGCSGSCCIAADQMGLDWRYIELHPDNYSFGVSRIADYLEAKAEGLDASEEELEEFRMNSEAESLSSKDIYKMYKKAMADKKAKKKSSSKLKPKESSE